MAGFHRFSSSLIFALLVVAGCGTKGGGGQGDASICLSSADCGGAQYCSGGACVSKLVVGACADASDHKAAEVCQSALCLGGSCCGGACPAFDQNCGAKSCDANGACQYAAASTVCGAPPACSGGALTPAAGCDGHGSCAPAVPSACPSGLCADATTCAAGCRTSTDCTSSQYCYFGQCAAKVVTGGTCGSSDACISGTCLGTFCCASACNTTDVTCGASSCDATGACLYPDIQTPCGSLQGCSAGTFTPPSACNGSGTCSARAAVPCEPYVCSAATESCFASCTATGTECAADSFCDAQKCAVKLGPGKPCPPTSTSTGAQACQSNLCSGNCCLADCPADPLTDNCKGSCDGTGACQPLVCPNNFGCSGSATCNTVCARNTDCAAGSFCDPVGVTACCSPFKAGDTLYVDGTNGSDSVPCCGAQASPCRSLTHSMALIASSAASGVTLQISNGNGSLDWTAPEKWPVHLGLGVTLNAPNIFFNTSTTALTDAFDIYAYNPGDTATVTIQGGAQGFGSDDVVIGYDSQFQNSSPDIAVNDGVSGKTAVPLVISNAWMNAGANFNGGQEIGLNVGAGAVVTLGPLPVVIGSNNGVAFFGSNTGIFCKGAGAKVQDDPTATGPVVEIDNQFTADVDAEDNCTVDLEQGPVIGTVSSGGGLMNCFTTIETDGIVAVGNAQVTFGSAASPGTIQCAFDDGIRMDTSNASGSPNVKFTGTVQSAGCAGAYVSVGTFVPSNATFTLNALGVWVDGSPTSVDLSGTNSFTCNSFASNFGSSDCNFPLVVPPSGADLLNSTGAIGIDAQNATWDNWTAAKKKTQLWKCSDTSYSSCTCTGPGCPAGTNSLPDDADAVFLSTNTAALPIDSTLGTQGPNGCP